MPQKTRRLPFRYLEPAFFAGLLDDPLLFVRIRPLKQALLFDCGQIAHLAKRVVKPIGTVFITHAHMDHIMGIPTLVRHHHTAPKPLDIFGPPGMADRMEHLLQGYDWNLCEPHWCTLRIHEVGIESIRHYDFSGPTGFSRRFSGEEPRHGLQIWSCRYGSVEAELLDHKIPVLAFKLRERSPFAIDPQLLAQRGMQTGEWIRELKRSVWSGEPGGPITGRHRSGDSVQLEAAAEAAALYAAIRAHPATASIGYLCDVGWTAANRAKITTFFAGVSLLCVDCTFLAADVAKARASYHLTTADVNDLMARLAPGFVLPMHLSKSYLHRIDDLYAELHPPAGTTVLPLPKHLVPAPLATKDVESWLRPPAG